MSMGAMVFLGVNLFVLGLNLVTVWMNIKLMTENSKHRLLEK